MTVFRACKSALCPVGERGLMGLGCILSDLGFTVLPFDIRGHGEPDGDQLSD